MELEQTAKRWGTKRQTVSAMTVDQGSKAELPLFYDTVNQSLVISDYVLITS